MGVLQRIIIFLLLQEIKGLKAPSYVSDWMWMDANDVSTTYVSLYHNWGVRPVKGDVQVKSPSTGFIYPGVKNAQNDNDNSFRGGVILVYDESEARVIGASNDDSGSTNGYIIYTGHTSWTPDNGEMLLEAYVRVRLWHPNDLPAPSASISTAMAAEQINESENGKCYRHSSDDIKIYYTDKSQDFTARCRLNITNGWIKHKDGSCIEGICVNEKRYPNYLELAHNLTSLPVMTVVQYYSSSTMAVLGQLVVEAQGTSSIQTHGRSTSSLQEASFVFAVNNSHIRLWAGNVQSGVSYSVFSFCDGWGYHTFDDCSFRSAYVDIKFWSDLQTDGLFASTSNHQVTDSITHDITTVQFNVDRDLVLVTSTPSSGENEGYVFDGTGAASTDGIDNSAGLIFAYNDTGIVRLWHPLSPYCIVQVGPAMGEDTHNQCAQDVDVTISIWRGVNCTVVAVENADFVVIGKTISYECQLGSMHVSGDLRRTCQLDDEWNGTLPVCKKCEPLETGTLTTIDIELLTTRFIANFTCVEGYTHLRGNLTRYCNQPNATWSGSTPVCGETCGPLETGQFATLDTELLKSRNIANYTCVDGLTHLSGNLTRYCIQPNATWSGSPPLCGEICGPLETGFFATLDTELLKTQNIANYTCADGYTHLSGNLTRYCIQPNATWSGSPPICGETCGPLETGVFATLDTDLLKTQNIANYTCVSGYIHLSGNLTRYCNQLNATWSGSPPVCGELCGPLETGLFAILDTEMLKTQNIANYSCDDGYTHLSGNLTRYCIQSNATWSGSPPVCGETCGSLETGLFATLDTELLKTQNIANYTCVDGYTHLSGNLTRYCIQSNATWSGSPPVCGGTCGSLETGSFATLDAELLKTQNIANYTCVDGYTHLSGNLTRYCTQPDATWSGSPPVCGEICNSLETGTLAIIDLELLRTSYVANFTCVEGYILLSGNLTRHCIEPNATWSGSPPVCGVLTTTPATTTTTTQPLTSTVTSTTTSTSAIPTTITSTSSSSSTTTTAAASGSSPVVTPPTTSISTSAPPTSNTSSSQVCYNVSSGYDATALEEQTQQIVANLTVDTKSTSKYTRSKISVKDNRPSSMYIGVTGCLIFSIVTGLFLVPDIVNVMRYLCRNRDEIVM